MKTVTTTIRGSRLPRHQIIDTVQEVADLVKDADGDHRKSFTVEVRASYDGNGPATGDRIEAKIVVKQRAY